MSKEISSGRIYPCISKQDKKHKHPLSIRLITWATGVRWFGWGFIEALIPIFLFQFSNSYAEAGVLRSIYDIAYILSLPLIGALADKISSRTLILIGLAIYPFIGLSYFLAGASGLVFLIVLARALNGVSYSFDCIGRDTYFMIHSSKNKVASAFGYFEAITDAWWIIGLLLSIFMVGFLKIHWLFLAIVPTSIIAFIIILFLKDGNKKRLKDGFHEALSDGNPYFVAFKDLKSWTADLKIIGLLNLILGFTAAVTSLFIPIYIFQEGFGLVRVILITAALATPALFDVFIGRVADGHNKRGLVGGFLMLAIAYLLLSITSIYLWQFIIVLGVGFARELIWLSRNGFVARHCEKDHYGRMNSTMKVIDSIGAILGAVIIGFFIDLFNMSIVLVAISVLTFGFVVFLKFKLDPKKLRVN